MVNHLGSATFFLAILLLLAATGLTGTANASSAGTRAVSDNGVIFASASVETASIGVASLANNPRSPVDMASGTADFPANPSRDSAQIEERETSATWISLLVSGILALLIVIFIGGWRARNR